MFVDCGRSPGLLIKILSTAIVLWTLPTFADQRTPLTLAEAEDLALAREPGTVALLERGAALAEQAVAAGQLPDPVMNVGVMNYPVSGGGFSAEPMTQAQFGIRQAFPRSRVRSLGTQKFESMADEAEAGAAARQRDVLQWTRAAWLDVYYWQRARDVVEQSRPFFADMVSVTRSLYAVGRKTQADVLRAELELSRLEDRLIETERSRAEAQARLSRWLGQDAWRPAALKMPAWGAIPEMQALQSALAQHPALEAADANIAARHSAVAMAEENKKPGWMLELGYGYRDGYDAGGEPRPDFVSLAVSFDLPFFTKNRQDRHLAAALREKSAALENRAALNANLGSQLAGEYARWSDLSRRIELYEQRILDQSTVRAEAAMLAYQSDAGDFADVMRASIDDLNTRLDHIRLQVERAKSYAAIASLGGFSR